MKAKYIFLEFKFPGGPWQRYDYTASKEWAEIQATRMRRDHPGAEYRAEKREK